MQPHGFVWRASSEYPRQKPFSSLEYPANALLHLGGPAGVGKSTLAKRLLADALVLSPDGVYRELQSTTALDNLDDTTSFAKAIDLMLERLQSALQTKQPVIVETTALYPGMRSTIARHAQDHDRPCHLLMLDASPGTCRQGVRRRGQDVPAEVVANYQRVWSELKPVLHNRKILKEHASVTVLDRRAINRLESITFSS